MSLLFRSSSAQEEIPSRGRYGFGGAKRVSSADSMRHSVVWAAKRLRADLISTMPVDVFRHVKTEGLDLQVPTPNVLVTPGSWGEGQPMLIGDWIYSTQNDLDSCGNAFGIIVTRDALQLPTSIQPVAADSVAVRVKDGRILDYRIGQKTYQPSEIWHERQFVVPGFPLGLSPIAHAALTLTAGMSALEFAHDWFSNGAVPGAVLQNNEKVLRRGEAREVKTLFKESVQTGEPFVTGKDWTYTTVQSKAKESGWIEQMAFSSVDLCRFMGVPGDIIDVEVPTGRLIYSNVTQRHLALLVLNLGPAIVRREKAFSHGLVASPRFVKLNRSALLAMDDETRARIFASEISSRTRDPNEARALNNMPPLTADQIDLFGTLFGTRQPAQPQPPGGNP